MVAVALAMWQWVTAPIAIEAFTVADGTTPLVFTGAVLADQLKGHITEINAATGDLFQAKKLGDSTVPIDVKISQTDWTLASIAKAFHIHLASAQVSGRLSRMGERLVLQATTTHDDDVSVGTYFIPVTPAATTPSSRPPKVSPPKPQPRPSKPHPPAAPPDDIDKDPVLAELDKKLTCVALRTMAQVAPDVAANYLFKRDVIDDPNFDNNRLSSDKRRGDGCIKEDDIELYSQVINDAKAPNAQRINALVGLSLHYASQGEVYDEYTMALAATQMATHVACEDPTSSRWDFLMCRAHWRLNGDRNLRSAIAAWMQLGAAYSDYANTRQPAAQLALRHKSIDAYTHVIRLKDDYALAYDAIGVQLDDLHETLEAFHWFNLSLQKGETAAAHSDLGWLYINRRNAFYGHVDRDHDWLAAAQVQFEAATQIKPDFWDAYRGLGYALLERSNTSEAIDVLKPPAIHDPTNRDVWHYLAESFAGACRFTEARDFFKSAYRNYADAYVEDVDNEQNTLTDWGKALDHFGATASGIRQEKEVLARNKDHVYARQIIGELEIKSLNRRTIAKGLADLKQAIDSDAAKQDFVLEGYLDGLTGTGSPDTAIAVYKNWSKDGLVPPLLGSADLKNSPPPRNSHVRLSYARSLAASQDGSHWREALAEFDRLRTDQIEFTEDDIRKLQARAKDRTRTQDELDRLSSIVRSAVPASPTLVCPKAGISDHTPWKDLAIH